MFKRYINLPRQESFFLFGPRQTGKSTFISEKFSKDVWTIDLLLNEIFFTYSRNPSLFRSEAIEKIKNENIKTIVIDEVQRLPELCKSFSFLLFITK